MKFIHHVLLFLCNYFTHMQKCEMLRSRSLDSDILCSICLSLICACQVFPSPVE